MFGIFVSRSVTLDINQQSSNEIFQQIDCYSQVKVNLITQFEFYVSNGQRFRNRFSLQYLKSFNIQKQLISANMFFNKVITEYLVEMNIIIN